MSYGGSFFDGEFDALVKEELEKWKIPGLSISIIQSSHIYAKVDPKLELDSLILTQDRHMEWQNCRTTPEITQHER
jgi:hypothetical protein